MRRAESRGFYGVIRNRLTHALMAVLAVLLVAPSIPTAHADVPDEPEPLSVRNQSFEEPVIDGEIPGWSLFGHGGEGSREVVDDLAYDGENSFRLVDPEDDIAYGLLSEPVAIQEGEAYEASYQVWIEDGVPSMYLYFYDEDDERIEQTSRHFRGLPTQEWVRVSIEENAPEGAVSVGILLYSLKAEISEFYIDQVELSHLPTLEVTDHGVAMFTANVRMADTAVLSDGTPVGYMFNDGEPVSMSVVDLRTGESLDRHEFPGYSVASSIVVNEADDAVYLSVRSPNDGTLWRYDPHSKALTQLATRIVGEEMLRSLLIHEGVLYGSTYPEARVYSYALDTGEIHDYGSVAPGVSYAWGFAEVKGDLWVGTGTTPYLREVDVDTGEISDLALPADITENADFINRMVRHDDLVILGYSPGGERSVALYDLAADEWCCEDIGRLGTWSEQSHEGAFYYIDGTEVRGFDIEARRTFSIGWGASSLAEELAGTRSLHLVELGLDEYPGTSLVGIREDGTIWRYNLDKQSGEAFEAKIDGAPATIHSMGIGPDGNPYMGAYLSSGVMARLDHPSGVLESLKGPGQADAITAVGDQLVIGTYPDARFYSGDPSQEWDWGSNPAHVFTIGRQAGQDRVSDLIAAGDLAAAATVPNYGELGGALVLVDPDNGDAQVHRDIVPSHSVTALAYRDGMVFGGTSIHGGLDSEPEDTAAQLFVWDVESEKVLSSVTVDEQAEVVHSLAFDDAGRLWGLTDNGTLFEYDVTADEVSRTVATALPNSNVWGRLSEMYPGLDGRIYGNAGGRLFSVDPDTADFRAFGPPGVRYSAMVDDGTIYFADLTNVYSFGSSIQPPEDPDPIAVVPAQVLFVDEPGVEEDVYKVPGTEGVEYVLEGEVIEAGTYPGVGTVTITARAVEGYVLAQGAIKEWSHAFEGSPQPDPTESATSDPDPTESNGGGPAPADPKSPRDPELEVPGSIGPKDDSSSSLGEEDEGLAHTGVSIGLLAVMSMMVILGLFLRRRAFR